MSSLVEVHAKTQGQADRYCSGDAPDQVPKTVDEEAAPNDFFEQRAKEYELE
jgi:hypothetical protein